MTDSDSRLIAITGAAAVIAAWRLWITPRLDRNPEAAATLGKWAKVAATSVLVAIAGYVAYGVLQLA